MKRRNDHKVMSLIAHAACRAARRNIPPAALENVLTYGRGIQHTGVTFYFLGRREVPARSRLPSQLGHSTREHRGPHE